MAREEIGKVGGFTALLTVLLIMIILLAVVALVVVNALKGSPWGTFTIAATMPIAVFMGLYLRYWRPGKVLECSAIGFVLVLASIFGGQCGGANRRRCAPCVHASARWRWPSAIIVYGFLASALPVWLLLAPRDYLSTFVKLGVVLHAGGRHPVRAARTAAARLHALRRRHRADLRRQDLPVLLHHHRLRRHLRLPLADLLRHHAEDDRQRDRTPGRSATARMLLESFVAIMAMIAACVLQPGVYFAVNSPAGVVGRDARSRGRDHHRLGLPGHRRPRWQDLAQRGRRADAVLPHRRRAVAGSRHGAHLRAAPAAARRVIGFWYHFAIMFEALFILTIIDAGTRVGRFMLQDLLGHVYTPLGRTSWMPGVIVTSARRSWPPGATS